METGMVPVLLGLVWIYMLVQENVSYLDALDIQSNEYLPSFDHLHHNTLTTIGM